MGLAVAKELYFRGAKVLVLGKDDENLDKAHEILSENATVLAGDALDSKVLESCVSEAHTKYGPIHGLFHVAGGSGRKFGDGPLHEMTEEGWQRTIDLNLNSVMRSNQAIIKYFINHKLPGVVLNMASVLAYSPSPRLFATHAYAASKAAIIGLSRSTASYYAPHNIRINVIAPALMDTPMAKRAINDKEIQEYLTTKQPLDGGRPGKVDDVVDAALMLLSPTTKFITGQVLSVDGGWSISEGQYRQI